MFMRELVKYLRSLERGMTVRAFRRVLSYTLRGLSCFDWLFSSNSINTDLTDFDFSQSKLFIYVHHSNIQHLSEFDRHVLDEAKASGFDTILVSNQFSYNQECADFVFKKGTYGRDFSILRDMARSLARNQQDSVEFFYLNDSMIWREGGITEIIERLRRSKSGNILFPTDSFNPSYHVQPYFLYVRLGKADFPKFAVSFEWIKNYRFRRSLIYFNEYRIANRLKKYSWTLEVLAPYFEVLELENCYRLQEGEVLIDIKSKRYNPTQHLWRSLSLFGIHAVKKSLVFQNPVKVENAPANITIALQTMR